MCRCVGLNLLWLTLDWRMNHSWLAEVHFTETWLSLSWPDTVCINPRLKSFRHQTGSDSNIIFTEVHLSLQRTRSPLNNKYKPRIRKMIFKNSFYFPGPTLRSTPRAPSSSSSWPPSSRGWNRASSTSPTSRNYSVTSSDGVLRQRSKRDTGTWAGCPPTLARCSRNNYRWH